MAAQHDSKLSGSNLWRLHIILGTILQVRFFQDLPTKGRPKNHGVAVLHHLSLVIVGFFFLLFFSFVGPSLQALLHPTCFFGGGNLQMQILKV